MFRIHDRQKERVLSNYISHEICMKRNCDDTLKKKLVKMAKVSFLFGLEMTMVFKNMFRKIC